MSAPAPDEVLAPTERQQQPQEGESNGHSTESPAETPASASDVSAVIDSWDKDPRYQSEWKGDPNAIFKKLREVEGQLPTFQQKLDQYEKEQLPQFQAKLQEYEQKVGTYQNVQQLIDFFDSDPAYQEAILQALNSVSEKKFLEKHPNLSPEYRPHMEKLELMEKKFQDIERQNVINENTKVLDSKLSEIEKLASQYGVEYNKRDFLMLCRDKNIPPNLVDAFFVQRELPNLIKMANSQKASEVVKAISDNKMASMPSGARGSVPAKAAQDLDSRLMAALKK